ncbi:hypothetical protein CK203_035379 [Vitis vinifera]|uniref:Reverse transcriptase domain-containing protein n=1 Tax=Vitis vinifera TaxID=29760 RepID=A0A438I3W8_VITVI|nr:hypothetical protein CK203_035379 [Vitis vinifera]
MGESTREVFESHSGTGGGSREERDRSTARGSFRVGEAGRKKKGGERSLVKVLPVGTCGKSGQVVGNSWFSLNLKKLNFGLVGTEMASVAMAGGDKAFSNENGRAFERKAQSLPKSSPLTDAKGKGVSIDPVVQTRGSAKKEVKFGSKKLWTTLFPPSFDRRQRFQSRNEPILLGKPSSDSEELPKKEAFGAGAQWERGFSASPIIFCRSPRIRKCGSGEGASSSRGGEVVRKPFFEEDREGFLGRVGSNLRGSSVTFLPSNPEIRGKGLSFMGTFGMSIAKNLESAYSNQLPESFNSIKSKPNLPIEVSNLVAVSQGDTVVSPLGEFQIESLSPVKMAKVHEVLSSLDIKHSFPQSLQEVLPRRTSDHWPIVLDTNLFKWDPTPFRFENMWLQHPSFKECFRSWWRGFQGTGWEGHKFIRKLQFVKANLKEWNKSITEEILLYFEKLYSGPTGESCRVEGLDWSPISEESMSRLDSLFTEKEISRTIFQLDRDKHRDKASGPDGFTIVVFQDCWDVIKDDLVRVRLRGVLHETIHSTQGAFVQGRQILDAVLIANEIVDEKRRSGEEGVVFKIDFEKAYNHVSWDFLDHMLEKKGISPRWRKWMRGCLSTVSFVVLVNGNTKGMLLRVEERNSLEGFRVDRNSIRVSHLQFADDTIFFSNTSEEELQTLKSLLLVFGHISGLKANLDKSNIYGINLEQNHLSRLAELLDYKASGWPIPYLGLHLGGNPKACGFWDPAIVSDLKKIRWLAKGLFIFWRWSYRCPWKAIAQVFQEFSKFTRFVIGDGEKFGSGKTCGGGLTFGIPISKTI